MFCSCYLGFIIIMTNGVAAGESKAGTGLVLLFDILPTLVVKCTAPFYAQRIPYQTVCMSITTHVTTASTGVH